ncbi:MAG: four helix bundle protein [Kiritimatiellae bacterium]|nr:four helix bundle protein [Kiritimatiellia bacterium]
MATIKRFTDIVAWQKSREMVKRIYELTRREPFSRDWGLKDQIQRASVSICSNIAEGFERSGDKEFVNFLWIAKGSVGEVASQLYNAKDCGYVDEEDFISLQEDLKLLSAMLYSLIRSMKTSSLKGERYK